MFLQRLGNRAPSHAMVEVFQCALDTRVAPARVLFSHFDVIDEKLFKRKAKAWREEMQEIEVELESMRNATQSYHEEGLKLLELAQVAHGQYLAANPEKQARILKCVGSNFVFDGVTVTTTYRKPFDVLAERPSDQEWLPGMDGKANLVLRADN